MKELNKKAFGGLFFLIAVLAVMLFVPAWTFYYWQAWIFLVIFSVSVLLITLYLMKKDPGLLAKRVDAGPTHETEASQKVLQIFATIIFPAIFILSALDHRFVWSSVPLYLILIGNILVAFGLFFVFLVFKENSFTSAVIEIDPAQKVISTGPYALVRHPMYAGAFVMLIGAPLALGSWWGMIPVIILILLIVWRLLDEEKFLIKNLAGYSQYRDKVKYRLIPWIW
jgi:Putative protein-S-isoprenylcysteine methyltransferase